MFVKYFFLEGYDNEKKESFTDCNYNPTWFDIEDAISQMETKGINGIYLYREEEEEDYMIVGGGYKNHFIVVVNDASRKEYDYNLVNNSSKFDEKVTMMVCTQLSTHSTQVCVNLETALKAAKTYAELGIRDPSLDWENPEMRRQRRSRS